MIVYLVFILLYELLLYVYNYWGGVNALPEQNVFVFVGPYSRLQLRAWKQEGLVRQQRPAYRSDDGTLCRAGEISVVLRFASVCLGHKRVL